MPSLAVHEQTLLAFLGISPLILLQDASFQVGFWLYILTSLSGHCSADSAFRWLWVPFPLLFLALFLWEIRLTAHPADLQLNLNFSYRRPPFPCSPPHFWGGPYYCQIEHGFRGAMYFPGLKPGFLDLIFSTYLIYTPLSGKAGPLGNSANGCIKDKSFDSTHIVFNLSLLFIGM